MVHSHRYNDPDIKTETNTQIHSGHLKIPFLLGNSLEFFFEKSISVRNTDIRVIFYQILQNPTSIDGKE